MLFVALLFSCVTDSNPEVSLSSSTNKTVEETKTITTKRNVEESVREKVAAVPTLAPPTVTDTTKGTETKTLFVHKAKSQGERSEKPEQKKPMVQGAKEESHTPSIGKEGTKAKEEKEAKTKIKQAPKKTTMRFAKPGPRCVRSIKQVLRRNNGDIRFCYDQQKVKDPTLEGKITLQINVYKQKNSMWVKKDTLKNRGLRTCLQKKIKSWEFEDSCVGTSFRKSYSLIPS